MPQEDERALLHDPRSSYHGVCQCLSGIPSQRKTSENWRWCRGKAARMVYADYRLTSSVTIMLQQLQWSTLQERRAQAKGIMVYRIVNSLVDIPADQLIPTISVRGHNMRFMVPFARTLVYQRSFFPDTIRLWNSLPQSAVSCPTLDSFKREVQAIRLR